MIKIVCKNGIGRAPAVVVGLFVADKDVKRLFFLGNCKNPLLNLIYRRGFLLINGALRGVRIFERGTVVIIVKNRRILCTIDGRHTLMRCRVFHIFNTVTAKDKRPIRFRVGLILIQYLFINSRSLVKFVVATEMICAVIQIRAFFIIKFRQRLLRSAVFANGNAFAVFYLQRAAAHFALKYGH